MVPPSFGVLLLAKSIPHFEVIWKYGRKIKLIGMFFHDTILCVFVFFRPNNKEQMNDYNESPPHFVPKWFHFKAPILCWWGREGGESTNGVQWDLTFIDLCISRMYVLGVQWNLLAIVEPTFIQHDIVQFWNAMNVFALGEFNPWKGCNSQNDKRDELGWVTFRVQRLNWVPLQMGKKCTYDVEKEAFNHASFGMCQTCKGKKGENIYLPRSNIWAFFTKVGSI
jgi:hypothetical protein